MLDVYEEDVYGQVEINIECGGEGGGSKKLFCGCGCRRLGLNSNTGCRHLGVMRKMLKCCSESVYKCN